MSGNSNAFNIEKYKKMSDHEVLQLERDIADGKVAKPNETNTSVRQTRGFQGFLDDDYDFDSDSQQGSEYQAYYVRLKEAKNNQEKANKEAQQNEQAIKKDFDKYKGENKPPEPTKPPAPKPTPPTPENPTPPNPQKTDNPVDTPTPPNGEGVVKPAEGSAEPGKADKPGECANPPEMTAETRKEFAKTDGSYGSTARLFETGNRGPGMVSSGKGDHGGVSYGVYQLPSKQKPAPVKTFLNQTEYRQQFEGLEPGSAEFNNKWKEVSEKDPAGFQKLQHDYNTKNNVNPIVSDLKNKGIDLSQRCTGLQELVYSTGTQFGPGKGKSVINKALSGKDASKMSDTEIMDAIYAEKSKTNQYFKSSSDKVQQSVYNRYTRESKINAAQCCGAARPLDELSSDELALDQGGSNLTAGGPAPIGFMDTEMVYPLTTRLNEPDFSRLARGIPSGTLVDIKNAARILKVPQDTTSGTTWDEPKAAFAAQYPDNIVWQTHGGVTMEFDSTKGKQRFHVWHPSNSFLEIYPNGQWVEKNTGDKYEIVIGTKRTFITGDNHVTVQGTNNTVYRSPQRDFYQQMKTAQYLENYKKSVDGNEFNHVKMNKETHIEGNEIGKIEVNREIFIKGDDNKVVNGKYFGLTIGDYHLEVKSEYSERILKNKLTVVEEKERKKIFDSKLSMIEGDYFVYCKKTTHFKSDSWVKITSVNSRLETFSKEDTNIVSNKDITMKATGLVTIQGAGIILKNSCYGVTVMARCWDVEVEGEINITAGGGINIGPNVTIPNLVVTNLKVTNLDVANCTCPCG